LPGVETQKKTRQEDLLPGMFQAIMNRGVEMSGESIEKDKSGIVGIFKKG